MPISPGGLAATLRERTRDAHHAAERAGIMPALLCRELPLADYRALLRNLQAIYGALEAALDRLHEHPCIAPVWAPALARGEAIRHDLARLGAAGEPAEALRPAAAAYVARVAQVAAESPARLVAHAYVRYLGDLSGGQILGRLVAESYGDAGATRFYDFGGAAEAKALAAGFRAGLDRLPAAEAPAIVDEALDAFERHTALFVELGSAAAA